MYDIKIQSPFDRYPVAHPDCNSEKAMHLYQQMDWERIYREIEETRSSPESPFYYFEINRKNNLGELETLCISGFDAYTIGIGYMRPKMERKGFFVKKDVLNPKFSTQMDGMEIPFALSCLEAFMKGDTNYLEENLHNRRVPLRL
ncbi:MAG: hypothetical protein J7623_16600 [Chitinophaga sp.]|uniref:hypothetical protein n=1 Tax=Chitinophaga sp. TaxID=1869181 RepID=UPI001B29AA2A|nr:hypothetical protein [Chitinophaga sp.]MBO9730262.1 hypothetical protein [Chitinophaga sp.]